MFLRFFGRVFFYFYVVPFIVDTLRIARNAARPHVLKMIQDAAETVKIDVAEIVKDTKAPTVK